MSSKMEDNVLLLCSMFLQYEEDNGYPYLPIRFSSFSLLLAAPVSSLSFIYTTSLSKLLAVLRFISCFQGVLRVSNLLGLLFSLSVLEKLIIAL